MKVVMRCEVVFTSREAAGEFIHGIIDPPEGPTDPNR